MHAKLQTAVRVPSVMLILQRLVNQNTSCLIESSRQSPDLGRIFTEIS